MADLSTLASACNAAGASALFKGGMPSGCLAFFQPEGGEGVCEQWAKGSEPHKQTVAEAALANWGIDLKAYPDNPGDIRDATGAVVAVTVVQPEYQGEYNALIGAAGSDEAAYRWVKEAFAQYWPNYRLQFKNAGSESRVPKVLVSAMTKLGYFKPASAPVKVVKPEDDHYGPTPANPQAGINPLADTKLAPEPEQESSIASLFDLVAPLKTSNINIAIIAVIVVVVLIVVFRGSST